MRHTLTYQVDRVQVRRYLGYQAGQTQDSKQADQLLEQMITAVGRVVHPQGLSETFCLGAESSKSRSVMGTGLVLTASDLLRLLQGCSRISLLMVTLGPDVDRLIDDLLEQGRYAAAAIADAIGSDAAEQVIEQLNQQLKQTALTEQARLTPRFSPGYGDVPLSLQPDLTRLLQAQLIGVSLTASCLLVPRKSITALIGWRQAVDEAVPGNKCNRCQLNNCRFRQQPPIAALGRRANP